MNCRKKISVPKRGRINLFSRGQKVKVLMGENDFSVERTGVTARQKAGTLERVVKYYQEAFTKTWDYLLQRRPPVTARTNNGVFSSVFLLSQFLAPGKGA